VPSTFFFATWVPQALRIEPRASVRTISPQQKIDAALDSNPEKEVWECWVESIVRNGDSHKWERYGPITHASQTGRIIQVSESRIRSMRPVVCLYA